MMTARYLAPSKADLRFGQVLAWLARRGIGVAGSRVLAVPGRKSGEIRTTVVNVIVLVEAFYLLNCRSLTRSMFSLGLFTNPKLLAGIAVTVALQVAFTYAPFMNRWFQSAPVSAGAWLPIVAVGLTVYSVVELEKWLRRTSPA